MSIGIDLAPAEVSLDGKYESDTVMNIYTKLHSIVSGS